MILRLFFVLMLAPIMAFAEAKSYQISIDGMTCDSCVKSVTTALSQLNHVDPSSVQVILKAKKATLIVKEENKETTEAIKKAIESVGYKVTAIQTHPTHAATSDSKPKN